MPKNGWTYEVDYIYADYVRRYSALLVEMPELTPIAQTCHTLNVFQRLVSFKNATIMFIHDDVSSTAKFLSGLSPSECNAIRGLRLDYRRTKPVNYKAFRELCHLMNTMSNLTSLHLCIPVNGPISYRLYWDRNILVLYHDYITSYLKHKWSIVKGLGWRSDKSAPWVLDLLAVKPGAMRDSKFMTRPKQGAFAVQDWLENIMPQDAAARRAAVEKVDRRIVTNILATGRHLDLADPLFVILVLLIAILAWVLLKYV